MDMMPHLQVRCSLPESRRIFCDSSLLTYSATATTTASTPAAKVLHGDSSSGNYVVAGTFNVRTGKFQAVSSEEHFMSVRQFGKFRWSREKERA